MTSIQDEIAALGPWFHNLHLPDGTQTLAEHPLVWGDFPGDKWRLIAPAIPTDLAGWRVLDIGCNAGFYSFELARRGASVVGIDHEPRCLRQARWAADKLGLADRVTFRQAKIYDLAHEGESFDLVWFMGVFYHLRYPLLGLDIAAQKAGRMMVFQTLTLPGDDPAPGPVADMPLLEREAMRAPGWPKMAFIEHRLAGDRTNWWTPNLAGVEAMLRSAGLRVTERLPQEVFVCEPDPANPSSVATWNRGEFLAATGQARGLGTDPAEAVPTPGA